MFKTFCSLLAIIALSNCGSTKLSTLQKENEKTLKANSAATRVNSGAQNSRDVLKDLD